MKFKLTSIYSWKVKFVGEKNTRNKKCHAQYSELKLCIKILVFSLNLYLDCFKKNTEVLEVNNLLH